MLLVVVVGLGLFGQGLRTTAGTPNLAGPPRATLPPPPAGEPFATPGRTTQELSTVRQGETVTFQSGPENATWRLDEFSDTPAAHRALVEAGNQDNERYRWILVRTTLGAVEKAAYLDLSLYVYLVDDRGLMIRPSPHARLPADCHPENRDKLVQPGGTVGQCLAFSVSANTPITEVALSVLSPENPGTPGSELLRTGARVPVTSQRVAGAAREIVGRVKPLGAWHDVAFEDVRARVAVVDVLDDISGYFDQRAPLGLPGSKGLVVRLAVRTDRPTSAYFLDDRLFLADDRGSAVYPDMGGGNPDTHGCMDAAESETFTGSAMLCRLFVIPTGTRVAAIGIGAPDRPYLWRVP